MEWLWLIYWGILFVVFVFGIVMCFKKHIITGLLQSALAIIVPMFSLLFAIGRSWAGTGENEIAFLFRHVKMMTPEAIMILLGYIILVILTIYHIVVLKKSTQPKGE